ncbi:MAG: hypothetical protein GF334_02560 [Candidatus Altiarchaeales archaeon]|nr:hypothetical protein [Candidatus Altiarchaeales archaeon]
MKSLIPLIHRVPDPELREEMLRVLEREGIHQSPPKPYGEPVEKKDLYEELMRIPGVDRVEMFGSGKYDLQVVIYRQYRAAYVSWEEMPKWVKKALFKHLRGVREFHVHVESAHMIFTLELDG